MVQGSGPTSAESKSRRPDLAIVLDGIGGDMGSHLLSAMPRSGRYRQVIALLGSSAGGGGAPGVDAGSLADIANATLDASLVGLTIAKSDRGLAYCVYLMVQVAQAARQPEFLAALERAGVPTPATISGLPDVPILTNDADYSVYDLTSGFSAAVDRHLRIHRDRSDISELAQLAGAESLSALCGGASGGSAELFGASTRATQSAMKSLSTQRGFSRLAHDFFARFIRRYIEYHLSRELSNHVGTSRRFRDVDEHNTFLQQLDDHCRICTSTMKTFAGEWYAKHVYLDDMDVRAAQRFAAHAIDKVRDALAHQEGRHVEK